MSGMNCHLETIASAFSTTQQHEQVIMAREFVLDQKQKDLAEKKKGLFDEMVQIPALIRVEAMNAAMKMVADESKLSLFYACPNNEWKKDFILEEIGREEGFSFCARHVKKEEQKTNVKQMQVSKMLKPICLKFVMGCLVRR